MSNIVGVENMSVAELNDDIRLGGKFVYYEYCFSILIMTYRRSSAIHFVRSDENRIFKGFKYLLISLLFGWWGFPWGLIYSPMCIAKVLMGGKDVTYDVMNSLEFYE